MSNKIHSVFGRYSLAVSLLVLIMLPTQLVKATGSIVTDGSMGAAQTLSGRNVFISDSLGSIKGSNLFHSFFEFNIANGQTVRFTGDNALHNVISRVTGADVTEIEGTLESSIGKAAFYFINPNGIIFGTGARVNVPGAFHISTADKINFASNTEAFYADRSHQSTLSSEVPIAFGFLGTSVANNGLIDINNALLEVKSNQSLDLVAGEILVNNQSQITVPTGDVRLIAFQGEGLIDLQATVDGVLPLPIVAPSSTNAGRIVVNAGAINTSGVGSGRFSLWGGSTSFTNSTVYNDNTGNSDAISAKDVDIRTFSLKMDNSWITADTEGAGKAANMRVDATNSLVIDNGRGIKSHAFDTGNAGNVSLQAGMLGIFNGGNVSSSTHALGNAGNVTVKADTLEINSHGYLSGATGIASQVNQGSSGNAGNIVVQTRVLDILNSGSISSRTFASGKAGNLNIQSGTFNILNGGNVSSSTFEQANAGNIDVTADTLTIDSQGNSSTVTGIVSQVNHGSGHSGNLTIKSGSLDVLNGGLISNSTFAQGNAGNINVTADALIIDRQDALTSTGIFSRANESSAGNAGNIAIHSGKLDILNGGVILNSTSAQGDAGNVEVTASKLTIKGQAWTIDEDGKARLSSSSGIISQANVGSIGHAGNIDIQAGTFNIINGGKVSSSSATQGDAGNIIVGTEDLTINGQGNTYGAGIASLALYSGQAGKINVKASNTIKLLNGGYISAENDSYFPEPSAVAPGNITIAASDIDMKASDISTISTGNVAAGNIDLSVSHWLTMGASSIINTIASSADGGNITVKGGCELIRLQDAMIKTSVFMGNHKGGDILMSADLLVMETGLIQANADTATGGDITMDFGALIPSRNTIILGGEQLNGQPVHSLIQAASNAHLDGKLNVTTPQLNLSGILANLGNPRFDTATISQDYCGQGMDSTLTGKGDGGIKPKSGDQLLY